MVPWQQILGAAVRGAVTTATGGGDYTYRRLSRRTATAPNIVLPSRQRVIPEIAVVIDTSGSVDERMLGQALTELDNIVSTLQISERGLIAVSVDTSAYNLRASPSRHRHRPVRRRRNRHDRRHRRGRGTTAAPGGRHCVHRRLHTVAGPTDRRNNPRCSRLPGGAPPATPEWAYPRRMCR